MEKKELYVSFDREEYKKSKTALLSSQVDVLNIMKHQENIIQIKQNQSKLKSRLHKLLSQIKQNLEEFEKAIPTPSIPKSIISQKIKPLPEIEKDETRNLTIDQELQDVQERLKQLNS